jgi:hypothetical protein
VEAEVVHAAEAEVVLVEEVPEFQINHLAEHTEDLIIEEVDIIIFIQAILIMGQKVDGTQEISLL